MFTVSASSTRMSFPNPLNTACLFLVFNRPETTATVFSVIKRARPPRLYVAADGPRRSKVGESELTAKVREIATAVDWPCELKTLFRGENLGCRRAVSEAITWFFQNEESGIVLEDDCLPSLSFFWYCEELLDRYRDCEQIKVISGDNKGFLTKSDSEISYHFIRYPLIWGWASWRRVWEEYDVDLFGYTREVLISENEKIDGRFHNIFKRILRNKLDTWDYQLFYSIARKKGICIIPNINLISNIGFGEEATHTMDPYSVQANVESHEIGIPLNHPPEIKVCRDLNSLVEEKIFLKKSIFHRVQLRLKRIRFEFFSRSYR